MTARLFVLAVLFGPLSAAAQQPAAASAARHLFEIRDGHVHFDGQRLPGAVPEGLDLSGVVLRYDYSGPITPVVEVDGQTFVLEDARLVRYEESRRAGEGVYIVGEARADVAAMGDDRLAAVSQEAYYREVAARDQALFEQMQREHGLEADVLALADRVRQTPAGPERVRLRGELRNRLSDLFSLKQQIRRAEVDRAQTEIDAVRALLDARDDQHDAIVDSRLRGLCEEPGGAPRPDR